MIFKQNINSIDINNIKGKVEIELNKDNVIEVVCDNKDIPIKSGQNTIFIGEKDKYNISFNNNSNIVIGKSFWSEIFNKTASNCVIVNGNVVTGDNYTAKKMPKANVKIKVPFENITNISLNIIGIANVEKISSEIKIDTCGVVELNVDGIKSVDLDTSGQSKGVIKNIEYLELDTSGQSTFKILDVQELSVDCSGQTSTTVETNFIKRAHIDISGQSSISITAKEIKRLNADLSGMSNVYVNGHIEQKTINKSRMSKFYYNGN